MALTLAQYQAIKADILADPTLSAFPNNGDGDNFIADIYNAPPAVAMEVWRTNSNVDDIEDNIKWAQFTPTDAIDSNVITTNRLLAIRLKQETLKGLIGARTTLNTSKLNIREGLADSTTNIPSGPAWANVQPGGAQGKNVLGVCKRQATRIEKLLNTGSATTPVTGGANSTTANIMGFEGPIFGSDVHIARVTT